MWFLPISSLQANEREAWKRKGHIPDHVVTMMLHSRKGKMSGVMRTYNRETKSG